MKCLLTVLSIMILNPFYVSAQNPVELGDVHWLRDIAKAQTQSKQTGKPILIYSRKYPDVLPVSDMALRS